MAQAEIITGLSMGGTIASTALGLPGTPSTQFHTATLLSNAAPDKSILVTGGFAVDMSGNAVQPPPAADAARVVTLASDGSIGSVAATLGGGYVSDTNNCMNSQRYRPAGWESAVILPNGRGVLITGGSPTYTTMPACNDCDSGGSVLCSSRQASIFTAATATIAPAPDLLQVGRFGHTTTLLSDGSVLITGGLTLAGGADSPRVSADAEVYNPRTAVPPYDMTQPAPVDLDDPIKADLMSQSLQRAPGGLAYQTDPKTPFSRCDEL